MARRQRIAEIEAFFRDEGYEILFGGNDQDGFTADLMPLGERNDFEVLTHGAGKTEREAAEDLLTVWRTRKPAG
jgi:hypothetical protein